MMYSSGTTGRPKGILRPMYDIHPSETSIAVLGIAALWRFREGMVYLSPAPLYHTAPQVSVAIALRMKSTAVVMEHFDPALYLDLVGRYRVTHSQVVPTMFSRMLKLPRRGAAGGRPVVARGHHPRRGAVPGAGEGADDRVVRADPARVLRRHRGQRLHLHRLRGLARAQGQRRPGRPERDPRSSTTTGSECPTGTPGTVWFAGATDFEYFRDPEKTASTRRDDGKTSTVGDVGYLDEDGYLFLTDRKAHMIISGGVNIYPQETENLLVTHPKVMDAAVIGVPNEDLGEEVKAVVQPVEGVGRRRGARAGAHRLLPGASGPLQVPPDASTSWTSCPDCPPGSSTRECCASGTGPTTTRGSCEWGDRPARTTWCPGSRRSAAAG